MQNIIKPKIIITILSENSILLDIKHAYLGNQLYDNLEV